MTSATNVTFFLKPPRIIVVGAGINGLACAVNIQSSCPAAKVEIVAEKLSPETTSEISAGFWRPFIAGDTDPAVVLKHSKSTHDYLLRLAYSELSKDTGVHQISGYYLSADDTQSNEDEIVKSVVEGYRLLTPTELTRFPMARSGYFHTTVQVNVTPYLRWLMKSGLTPWKTNRLLARLTRQALSTLWFTEKGGLIHTRKVSSLREFAGHCDLVINCCGLGGRDLMKDDQVVPVRGQVWRIHAPWIKHFYIFKPTPGLDSTYILPGVNNVVVGGTAQVGDWRTEIDEDNSISIWKRAQDLLPQIAKATPIRAWVGLRPARTTLRLESELLDFDGQKLKVVHNYGHGGSGITLHWGCAVEATKLALSFLGHPTHYVQQVKSHM